MSETQAQPTSGSGADVSARPRPSRGRRPAMPRRVRQLLLTLHVAGSVGWIGLLVSLLVLGVIGLSTDDPQRAQVSYMSLGLLAELLLPPFAVTALVTGLLLGVGTRWGLLRHWWVSIKLVLTLMLVGGGILFTGARFAAVAEVGRSFSLGESLPAAEPVQYQVIGIASIELLVILAATVLAIYKPWGLTPRGRKRR